MTGIKFGRKKVLDNFYAYCEEQGILILKDDKRFITEQTMSFPDTVTLRKALHEYVKVWQEKANETNEPHKKDNKGRYAANVYLREVVKTRHSRGSSA